MSHQPRIGFAGFLSLATVFSASALVAEPSSVPCSRAYFDQFRLDAVRFIGTATGDTLLAGPGDVLKPDVGGRIHGQVFRVERADSVLTSALGGAVDPGRTEVVLVPWNYDASCQRFPWISSARWAPLGLRGLYRGQLRQRAHWVGNRPTFDVTDGLPYPPRPTVQAEASTSASRDTGMYRPITLTADEMLGLYEALPLRECVGLAADARVALEPFHRWLREQPELARSFPVMYIRLGLGGCEDRAGPPHFGARILESWLA